MLPTLELKVLLERTDAVLQQDQALIVEESREGLPLVGAVAFRRQDSGGQARTLVTLSLAYYLPGSKCLCRLLSARNVWFAPSPFDAAISGGSPARWSPSASPATCQV